MNLLEYEWFKGICGRAMTNGQAKNSKKGSTDEDTFAGGSGFVKGGYFDQLVGI